jgi:hypothetical protein
MAVAKMEQENGSGLIGLAVSFLGWIGTMLGSMWNIQSMQIISFLFAAFAGLCTGLYYIVKAIIEIIKTRRNEK